MVGTRAFAADPTAIACAFSARFDKVFIACDVPAVLELYEDGATATYMEELAQGKVAIEKMVKSYCNEPAVTVGLEGSTAAASRGRL